MGATDYNPLEGNEKYRVERLLGEGSMGEVYLGRHVALDKPVVIKVILAELASSATDVDRMRHEAQALARLDHPNIVRVTDFDQTPEGRPFMVMDFLAGHTVAAEMRQRGGVLPVAEAVEVARQAAGGLAGAHHVGLVHRDLKLENLFLCDHQPGPGASLTQPRTVKLIDFGLAKSVKGAPQAPSPLAIPTEVGFIVGTPAYLAPEQAAGRQVDHRADIYALGLVMYALVVGRGPFDDEPNIGALIAAQLSRTPEPPSRHAPQAVPPELDALVLRCLAKPPDDRPQSATELSAKLASLHRRLAVAGDATAPRVRPVVFAGGSAGAPEPVPAAVELVSSGRPAFQSLASTLPMDSPQVSEMPEDVHRALSHTPTRAHSEQLLNPALASTVPMADDDEPSRNAPFMATPPAPPTATTNEPGGAPPAAPSTEIASSAPPAAPSTGIASSALSAAPSTGIASSAPPSGALATGVPMPPPALPIVSNSPPAPPLPAAAARRSPLLLVLVALVVVAVVCAALVLALWLYR